MDVYRGMQGLSTGSHRRWARALADAHVRTGLAMVWLAGGHTCRGMDETERGRRLAGLLLAGSELGKKGAIQIGAEHLREMSESGALSAGVGMSQGCAAVRRPGAGDGVQ